MKSRLLTPLLLLILLILLSACTPVQGTSVPVITPTAPGLSFKGTVLIAYVQGGNLYLWDSSTGQSQKLTDLNDVVDATISDDGQVIAFQRNKVVGSALLQGQYSLWAVDRNGSNLRELVSADTLVQRLHPAEGETTSIAEMTWIPHTHRLIYSGAKGNAAANDIRPAEDVYIADMDALTDTFLAPAGTGIRVSGSADGPQFVPSADGKQIAILSGTHLNFVNADGSNLREGVVFYDQSGAGDVPFVPTGVWTQDGNAFLINAPVESSPETGVSYSITRVSLIGEPIEYVNHITNSYPATLTFAPDGKHISFASFTQTDVSWPVVPLDKELGPLAVPVGYTFGSVNLHWSPAGDAYIFNHGKFSQLCPNAADGLNVCKDVLTLGGNVSAIQWLDAELFVLATDSPSALLLSNTEGKSLTIASGSQEQPLRRFSATLLP